MRLIAAIAADDHLILHQERSGRDVASALPGIVHADFPYLAAGLLIERYQEIVFRAEENFTVADRDDASNLAIVLLDALKVFHVKNEVVESPAHTDDSLMLAVRKQGERPTSYQQLLKIVEKGETT